MNNALLDVSRPDYLVFKTQGSTSSEKSSRGAKPKQPKTKKQEYKRPQQHDKKKSESGTNAKKVATKEVQESIEDIPGYVELKKQIDDFVGDKEKMRMEFSSGLTSRERYIVHEVWNFRMTDECMVFI